MFRHPLQLKTVEVVSLLLDEEEERKCVLATLDERETIRTVRNSPLRREAQDVVRRPQPEEVGESKNWVAGGVEVKQTLVQLLAEVGFVGWDDGSRHLAWKLNKIEQ